MKINITKKQYALLIKMLYLGDLMINSHELPDDRSNEIDEVFNYILSFAKEFGMEDMISEYEGKLFPSGKIDQDELVQESIESYDDEVFWDELIDRMAGKEILNKYTEKEIINVEWLGIEDEKEKIREKYFNEFKKNGLSTLEINTNNKKTTQGTHCKEA